MVHVRSLESNCATSRPFGEHLRVDTFSFVYVLRFYVLKLSRIADISRYNFACVDTFSFVFSLLLRSQVIAYHNLEYNLAFGMIYIYTSTLFETGNSFKRIPINEKTLILSNLQFKFSK